MDEHEPLVSTNTSNPPPAQITTASLVRRGFSLPFIALGFFLLYLFGSTSRSNDLRLGQSRLIDAQLQESLVLGNLTYEQNATRYSSDLRTIFNAMMNVGHAPVFYSDIAGQFKGKWELLPFSKNISELLGQHSRKTVDESPSLEFPKESVSETASQGNMDLTAGGKFSFTIISNKTSNEDILYINGNMNIDDGYNSFDSTLHGLHFKRNGSIYLESAVDESELFLHNIPKMMLDPHSFQSALSVIRSINMDYLNTLKKQLDNGMIIEHVDTSGTSSAKCRFLLFMQLQPLPAKLQDILDLENVQNEGVYVIQPPQLLADMALLSPNCNSSLKSIQLRGIKNSIFISLNHNAGVFIAILTLIELVLTTRQMQQLSSLSARTKISPMTMGMMIILDAYMCIVLISIALMFPELFSPFVAASFLKFCLFSVFEMRYLFAVIQARRRDGSDSLERSFLFRVYLYTFIGGFFIYHIALRSTLITIGIMFLMHSLWIPQVVSNAKRNTWRAFNRSFVIGTSITRFLLPLYAWYYQDIIIASQSLPSAKILWALAVFISIQVGVLILQDVQGPRIFIPQQLFPQTYDYHPAFPPLSNNESISLQMDTIADSEIDSNQSIYPPTSSNTFYSTTATRRTHAITYEKEALSSRTELEDRHCAICFTEITTVTSDHPFFSTERLKYMVTPCNHLFHSECLERWMEVKLEVNCCDLVIVYL
ncbi:hypothetical protein QVD99_003407 [Batrachochytrium dendrobatidis]|nr:hypothetical protein QVD99_003407 [Batrachochytrium dendrobatidis]